MTGRKREPLAVIQGKGKSNHLTKAVIKKRQEQEEAIKGFTDKIKAPTYLTARQKKEFDFYSDELVRLKIFSNLDVGTLAQYVDAYDEYIKVAKAIRRIKPVIKVELISGIFETVVNENYTKLKRSQNDLSRLCQSLASALGLTITSRLKLVIPKSNEEKPINKFNKFAK